VPAASALQGEEDAADVLLSQLLPLHSVVRGLELIRLPRHYRASVVVLGTTALIF